MNEILFWLIFTGVNLVILYFLTISIISDKVKDEI